MSIWKVVRVLILTAVPLGGYSRGIFSGVVGGLGQVRRAGGEVGGLLLPGECVVAGGRILTRATVQFWQSEESF